MHLNAISKLVAHTCVCIFASISCNVVFLFLHVLFHSFPSPHVVLTLFFFVSFCLLPCCNFVWIVNTYVLWVPLFPSSSLSIFFSAQALLFRHLPGLNNSSNMSDSSTRADDINANIQWIKVCGNEKGECGRKGVLIFRHFMPWSARSNAHAWGVRACSFNAVLVYVCVCACFVLFVLHESLRSCTCMHLFFTA